MTEKIPKEKNAFSAPEKYHAHNVLGSGGMKIVIRSDDIFAGREVAMAIAKNSSEESQKRFLDEARITARLEHPNIVPVHEIGRSNNGIPYFTMKMVQGKTLLDILTELRTGDSEFLKKYPLTHLLDIFLKVCDAISFAHSKGILHLDLKPDNIQVGEFGEVLVLDWGLARYAEKIRCDPDLAGKIEKSGGITKTVDGVIKGTPEYMAPEQALGKNSLRGVWTDVYALGALLYAMLTFHAPYENDDTELVIRAVARGKFASPHDRQKFKRDVPQALECIVYKAMSRIPSKRYESVAALKADVEAYINGYATEAEEAGFYTNAILWLKRKRVQIYIYTSILLLGIILSAFFGTVLHLKKMEKEVYAITVNGKIQADSRRAGLEAKIQRESTRDWLVRFEDSFSDPYIFERWRPAVQSDGASRPIPQTEWEKFIKKTDSGLLLHSDSPRLVLAFQEKIPGSDISIQTDVMFEEFPVDACFTIRMNSALIGNGYSFNIRSGMTPHLSLTGPSGDILGECPLAMNPAGTNSLRAVCMPGAHGMMIEFHLNGRKVYSVSDRTGIPVYARCAKYAFEVKHARVLLREMKIMTLGMPIKSDILDLADRQLRKGNYDVARELYIESEDSALGPARRRRAAEGQRMTRLLKNYREKASAWHEKLEKAWPGAEIKVYLNPSGFSVSASGGKIRNFSPLREMPLSSLSLSGAETERLEELQSLNNLRKLSIVNCGIQSLEPLRGLMLEELVCDSNPIADLSPLEGMPLRRFSASNCAVESVRPLRNMPLEEISLAVNRISDLGHLPRYKLHFLDISCNRITDLSGLSGLPLTDFSAAGNKIVSLEPLRGMRLKQLNCANNDIVSTDPLAGMPLEFLNLSGNKVENLNSIGTCARLRKLFMSDNKIRTLSPLGRLSNLEYLEVKRNELKSLIPAGKWKKLEYFSFAGNRVKSLEPIGRLVNLRLIDCSNNPVESLESLDRLSPYTILCGNTSLRNFGKFILFPPDRFLFAGIKPNREQMELIRTRLFETPANKDFRRFLRIAEAFHAGDAQSLKAMARRIGKKRYTLIPLQTDFHTARILAKKFGAHLPMPKTPIAQMELFRRLECPFWVGISRDGKTLRWDDGTPYMSFQSGLPECSFHTMCIKTSREPGTRISPHGGENNQLPLIFEWPEEAK